MKGFCVVEGRTDKSGEGGDPQEACIGYRFQAGIEGLDAIRAPWTALADRLGPRKGLPHVPFWYRCQMRCLPGCGAIGFATAWEGERLVAVLPLVSGKRGGWGMLGFSRLELPNDPYNFFCDATIDPAAAPRISLARLARVACGAMGGGGLLCLRQLRADAMLLDLPGVGRLAEQSARLPSCLYIPLHPGLRPDELLSGQSRADLNNGRNRLRRLGRIECKHAPEDLPIADANRIFTEVEASGWKGESGTRSATKYLPGRMEFVKALAGGGDGLQVHVHLMFAESTPVAGMYCINIGTAHLILLSGYDQGYQKASPGHLLIHEVIQWAVARQLRELDFMSCAPHFARWHPAERSMHQVSTSDGSVKGQVVDRVRRLRDRMAKTWDRRI